MKIAKWLFLIMVLAVAVVVVWGRYRNKSEGLKQAFKLAAVSKGAIQAVVTSTGRLNPLNTFKVGSQVSGNIKELYVNFNSPVKRDQVVALIDPAIYNAQVEQAKAQLVMAEMQLLERQNDIDAAEAGVKSAEAQLSSSQATFRDAGLNYGRLSALGNTVARADVDTAEARKDDAGGAVARAKAGILTAKAQLMRAVAQEKGVHGLIAERRAELNLAETKLGYCTIRSPVDGVVISREVDVGQTVAATLQSPILFTVAEDLKRMQAEVDVSEADVGQIQPGQDVRFTVDAFPEKTFKAKVREVRNVATNIQNVVTYTIVADVENDALLLRPGMTANVTIVVAEVKDVLKVPNGALRFKPPGEGDETASGKRTPITERRLYKDTVSRLGLGAEQAGEFVKIIERAGVKLKAVYALPEGDRNLEQAWKTFYTQVYTDLYRILREDQHGKFRDLVAELKEAQKKRSLYKGRPAKVYIPGADGRPMPVYITAGITDEDESQVVQGDLEEGDKVIVGLLYDTGERPAQSGSIFSTFLKGK